jgi:hypothetical protein
MKIHEWLIGIDPGLMTGIALVEREDDIARMCWSGEVAPEELAPTIRPWLGWWNKNRDQRLTVVVEAFIITQRTAQLTAQPFSLENIGIVKQCMWDAGMDLETQFVLQRPSAKTFADNKKLQRVELWHRGGAGHANDALRHVIVRMINTGWRDPRLLDSNVREPPATTA